MENYLKCFNIRNFHSAMGTHISKRIYISKSSIKNKAEETKKEAPQLTEREQELLMESWNILKTDISKVGVITFVGLFETHPEVQDAFMPFRNLSKVDMEKSAILRSHALRVMGTVDKCMSRLTKPEKFADLMLQLGQKHVNYHAKEEYIHMVGPQFVQAIKPHVGEQWSNEMEEAWLKMFILMSYHMENGMKNNNKST